MTQPTSFTVESSPDPIDEPKAYQDLLVGLVGTDDPAEVQAATPGLIRALIATAGPDLRTRPAASEWSVLECVAHMTDAELVASGRYRWILAHDEPELVGYDQDLWVNHLHQPTEEPPRCCWPCSSPCARRTSGCGPERPSRPAPGSECTASEDLKATS